MDFMDDLKKIKEILKIKKNMSYDEIVKSLNWSPKNKKNNKAIILSWLDAGEIVETKRGRFSILNENDYVKGMFSIIKNKFAFVDVERNGEKEGIFIHKNSFNNALDGDTVLVKITKQKTSEKGAEGEVVKIVSRKRNIISGILEKKEGKDFAFLVPNHTFGRDIYIAKENMKNAKNGDLVVAEVNFWGDSNRKPEGEIIEVLGDAKNTRNIIDSIILREGISEKFSIDVMKDVEKIIEISKNELEKERKDLTSLSIITIDGEDAKDLDDAVYVEKLENENYRLIVSIADVSHYVKLNTAIDEEAKNRGNSVYLVDRVLPMFPKEISNGVCSLNEKEIKATFTCEMEIDKKGEVINSEVYKSYIKSVHRMTYTDVNLILADDKNMCEKYQDIKKMLGEMLELSKILRDKKYKRGSIDFELPEIKVKLNEEEKVEKIFTRERGEAEKIIEDFMIAANETVAERIFWLEIPSVYRTHEKPSRESINKLNETLFKFGYKIPNLDNIHPKQFQEIIERSRNTDISMLVHKMILMALKQAKYTTQDIGHFGLASKHYTHFTSPIRRYSDLLVHRILNNILTFKKDKKNMGLQKLTEICLHISETERKAMKIEEESLRVKLVEYMSEKIGEIFDVIIVGFSQKKVFVETKEHVECSWDVTEAKHFYEFDEDEYIMFDRDDSEKKYSLGDKIKVILERTDLNKLEIAVRPLDVE